MSSTKSTLPINSRQHTSAFNPIRCFVVLMLATGLLVLGAVLVLLALRPELPGTATAVLPTPAPSLAANLPAASLPTSEAAVTGVAMTPSSATPETTAAPASLLPVPIWQPSAVPSDMELEAMIAAMTLQDKIAQMVMVGFHGQSIADSPELETMVGTYHVGGLVLLEPNAHDPQQLSALTTELQALATSSGGKIPLFIAINHEGGIVVRITEGVTGFPGNMAVAAAGQPEYAYISAALAAQELRTMGVNMNLAPVLDINDNPLNPVIGVRSFGDDPALVADYARLAVRGSQDNGVIAVAKHFPGHGSVAVDSHGDLPVLYKSLDELMPHELLPFQAAIEEGVACIMTAHIAVPALDDSGLPATLSPKVLTDLLRERMGYDGLIMTDSLGMAGASAGRGQDRAAVEAVLAGADIVLSTTPMEAHIAIIQALTAAVQRGEIPLERIDQSVRRILRIKYAYGLFEPAQTPDLTSVGSPEHQTVADEIAFHAVTLLRDSGCIPLPPSPARLLLVSPSQLPPATSGEGSALAELLRRRGYEITELTFNLDSENRSAVYANAVAQAANYDVVIFGEWELIKRYMNGGDQWQERLIAELSQIGRPLIVVAWHNPAAILRCPQSLTFLTAYGNTRAQVAAVVTVLTGEQSPTGHLPMAALEAIISE